MESKNKNTSNTRDELASNAHNLAETWPRHGTTEQWDIEHTAWRALLKEASPSDLVEVTAMLTSDSSNRAANLKALREAVISEIERKNTNQIVETMKHLDRSTQSLSNSSFVLATVGAIIALLQLFQKQLESIQESAPWVTWVLGIGIAAVIIVAAFRAFQTEED